MTLFGNAFSDFDNVALRLGGAVSPAVVKAIYPMDALSHWHEMHHIKAITGRWMDGGGNFLTGVTRGSYHRLEHGHHLFEDGYKVLINPKLKFGEFLHHLGLDSLTTRGIPNPLLPTALVGNLENLGLSKAFVNELMTVNVPKILGGSLGLICSGNDVYMAFSDTIPHTFTAAGPHLLFGTMDLCFGMYPPNFLLLLAGTSEIGVAGITAYRALVDPVLPIVHVPGSVYFPLLGHSVLLAGLIGGCAAYWTGASWAETGKTITAATAGVTVSTTFSLAAHGIGFLAPFLGPAAGIATALLVRKMLTTSEPSTFVYSKSVTAKDRSLFPCNPAIPVFGCPSEPIGCMKGEAFLPNAKAITRQMEGLVA
jgi:hypothetical protein